MKPLNFEDYALHKGEIGMRQHRIMKTSEPVSTDLSQLGKSEDPNENVRRGTAEFPLSKWTAAYPTAAALLAELECPAFLDLVAGTSPWRSLCQDALVHWKELGRPEVSWQDAAEWECVQ